MKKIVNFVRENVKNHKLVFAANVVVSILAGVSYLGLTLSIQLIISVVSKETDYTLLSVSIFAVCMLFYYALMSIFSETLKGHLEIRIEQKIRTNALNTLFRKTMLSLQKMHSGEILTRLTDDVRNITSFVVNVGSQLVMEIVTAVLAITYMFILSWEVALIMIVVVPLLTLITTKLAPVFQKLSFDTLHHEDSLKSFFQDLLKHFDIFKIFNMGARKNADLNELYAGKKKSRIKLAKFQGFFIFANNFMSFGVFIITLVVGAFFAIKGDLEINKLIAIVQLTNYTAIPLNSFSRWVAQAAMARVSTERLDDIDKLCDEGAKARIDNKTLERIRVSDIEFCHEDDVRVLDHVSAVFEKGSIVGIIGKSGSGKSTLLNIIAGLYNANSGEVSFESGDPSHGCTGIDEIGYVPSDRFVFDGTIKDNICMSLPYNQELLESVLKGVNLDGYINSLPEGIDTVIQENGKNLSMGQAQRIAIARALYSRSNLIIFDEPTSNLDAQSIEIFHKYLMDFARDRIVLIATHDQNTIDYCDVKYKVSGSALIQA